MSSSHLIVIILSVLCLGIHTSISLGRYTDSELPSYKHDCDIVVPANDNGMFKKNGNKLHDRVDHSLVLLDQSRVFRLDWVHTSPMRSFDAHSARYINVIANTNSRGVTEFEKSFFFIARLGHYNGNFSTFAFMPFERNNRKFWCSKRIVSANSVAHNLGVCDFGDGTLVGAGGQDRVDSDFTNEWKQTRNGIVLLNRSSVNEMLQGSWMSPDKWRGPVIIPGSHENCYEKRFKKCEFDGKISIVHFKDEYLIYARANLVAGKGGRYVQVTKSTNHQIEGPYGSFQLLEINGYATSPDLIEKARKGSIYLATVKVNPILPSTLVAFFAASPLIGDSMIGLSFSCDGVHWSEMINFYNSTKRSSGRQSDHPVDGFVHVNSKIYAFIEADVIGLSGEDHRKSRLIQYALNPNTFRSRSVAMTKDLIGCS